MTETVRLMLWNDNAPTGRHRIALTLTWQMSDACAVEAEFTYPDTGEEGEGLPVVWLLSRDLLCTGLAAKTGDGDVQMRPCGYHSFALTLTGPAEQAVLRGNRARLREFLERTYQRVPVGREFAGCDWNDVVSSWEAAA